MAPVPVDDSTTGHARATPWTGSLPAEVRQRRPTPIPTSQGDRAAAEANVFAEAASANEAIERFDVCGLLL